MARDLPRGYVTLGQRLSTEFLGGVFSLDGIHPTYTGHALIANEFIRALNTQFAAGIPPVSVGQVAASDPLVHRRVKTGNPEMSRAGGLLAPALAMPIFKGAMTEWLPTLGVSWHVPQKPSMSLSPATPVILIWVPLNICSPRTIDAR